MKLFVLLALLLVVAVTSRAQEEETAPETPAAETVETADAPAADAAAEGAAAAEGDAAALEGDVTSAVEKAEDGGCAPCPVISIQHYDAKNCDPVMDEEVDKCCPSSYTCRSEEAMGVPLTSCFYGNVTYEVGQDVPVKGPCRRGCQCRASLDKQHPAKIECAIVECPSKFSPLKPGCRSKFSVEECCEVEQECNDLVSNDEVVTNENVTLRSADCFSEGFEYYLGDKIFFGKAPCQYCVCSEEFTGSSGPSCTKMDCAMEYRDREYLVSGCIPLYRDGTCCPTDWICPDSPQIISDPDMVAKGDETASTHCTIGKTVAPRGTALKTYDCHVNCACSTPPDFTCVQYATCEIALSALKAGTTL